MRQVSVCLEKIGVRRHNNARLQASFHGIKIPEVRTKEQIDKSEIKLSDDQNALIARHMQEAQNRKRREVKRGR